MDVLARLEKLRRLWMRRWGGRGALPLWWHVGRPNFGDDINPDFFGAIAGRSIRFAADRTRPHLLGAGSILERAAPASIVCGSGFLREPRGIVECAEVVAVRGERSLAACPRREGVLLGDPLVLVDTIVAPAEKRHRVGFVPHVTSVRQWRRMNSRDGHLVDPGWSPRRVVEEIGSCEVVFSQSLHGLIVADAFGVPNVWVAPGDEMAGGRFKFDDYFSTLDAAKEPVPEAASLFRDPPVSLATVGRYRFSKAAYRQALADACVRLAGPRAVAG